MCYCISDFLWLSFACLIASLGLPIKGVFNAKNGKHVLYCLHFNSQAHFFVATATPQKQLFLKCIDAVLMACPCV